MDIVEMSDEEESENVKGFLSNQLKNNIQTRIQDVIVPKGVTSITSQVGSSRNGKLKASCDEVHEGPVLLIRWLDDIKDYEMGFEQLDLFLDSFIIKHLKFSNDLSFISSSEIVGLAAYRSLPAWALGCKDITMLIKILPIVSSNLFLKFLELRRERNFCSNNTLFLKRQLCYRLVQT
ncbi:hypothetical protein O181_049975 [Austropuccinia psidii MF-1]|uniref:Uncharacterized protein n=1 Tax=Austropuccinia psidii MF-1 TaxID=1389203 RepID=A0A9Q3E079_9BASI|nr:hypothetical protein [Austropuccinia psidii MF-1]